MDRALLRRVLELLYLEYPRSFTIGRFIEGLGIDSKPEFNKIIRYLRATNKIIATEKLNSSDEISLMPEGIDFLEKLRLEDSQEKIIERQTNLTEVTSSATIILGLIALLQGLLLPFTEEWQLMLNSSYNFLVILFILIYISIIIFIVIAFIPIINFFLKRKNNSKRIQNTQLQKEGIKHKKEKSYLRYKGQITSLIIAFIISFILMQGLLHWDETRERRIENFLWTFNLSEDEPEFVISLNSLPFYFSTIGNVTATISSPYMSLLDRMQLKLSLDRNKWNDISLIDYNISLSDKSRFSHIGYINLEEPNHLLYGRITLPKIVSNNLNRTEILKSFKAFIATEPIKTRKDYILVWIISIGIFGTLYTLLVSFFDKFFSQHTFFQ